MLLEELIKHFKCQHWGVCQKHAKDITPELLRLTIGMNCNHYFLNLYINNISFKDLDVNLIRQFKDNLRYIFPSILEGEPNNIWKQRQTDNPAVWNEFCKEWIDIILEFRKYKT